jgi:hypothetical protein
MNHFSIVLLELRRTIGASEPKARNVKGKARAFSMVCGPAPASSVLLKFRALEKPSWTAQSHLAFE